MEGVTPVVDTLELATTASTTTELALSGPELVAGQTLASTIKSQLLLPAPPENAINYVANIDPNIIDTTFEVVDSPVSTEQIQDPVKDIFQTKNITAEEPIDAEFTIEGEATIPTPVVETIQIPPAPKANADKPVTYAEGKAAMSEEIKIKLEQLNRQRVHDGQPVLNPAQTEQYVQDAYTQYDQEYKKRFPQEQQNKSNTEKNKQYSPDDLEQKLRSYDIVLPEGTKFLVIRNLVVEIMSKDIPQKERQTMIDILLKIINYLHSLTQYEQPNVNEKRQEMQNIGATLLPAEMLNQLLINQNQIKTIPIETANY